MYRRMGTPETLMDRTTTIMDRTTTIIIRTAKITIRVTVMAHLRKTVIRDRTYFLTDRKTETTIFVRTYFGYPEWINE